MQEVATRCKEAADEGDWVRSTQLWVATEIVVWELTNYIDFYNILKYVNVDLRELDEFVANNETSASYEDLKREFLRKKLRERLHRSHRHVQS